MPQATFSKLSLSPASSSSTPSILTINVGGQIFQTTEETLTLAGPNSLLSKLVLHSSPTSTTPFIDRDPELFSILLSLLRSGQLPSKFNTTTFDLQDLILESRFYGIEPLLISSLSNPSQFDALNLVISASLPLNGRDTPSAISATPCGSLHVAHGCKITSFDWSLTRKSTVLTRFAEIDSLLAVTPGLAAAGATDFSGLQIIDTEEGTVRQSLSWENATRSSSTVQAIGASPDYLFTSYESGRRNSNAIVVYDLASDFKPVAEIARNEIYGAEVDSAYPATKLTWAASRNLLVASGSYSGPSRVSGNIKLWDVRSGKPAWEMNEKEDCFSDVTYSDELSALFKVGVNSGEVWFVDLRRIGGGGEQEGCWVCLGDERRVERKKDGVGCKIESHGRNVFRSRGGELEVWSEVKVGELKLDDGGGLMMGDRDFRRSGMGRAGKDVSDGKRRITILGFGGNKMFVSRKDQQAIEVWQSSTGN